MLAIDAIAHKEIPNAGEYKPPKKYARKKASKVSEVGPKAKVPEEVEEYMGLEYAPDFDFGPDARKRYFETLREVKKMVCI